MANSQWIVCPHFDMPLFEQLRAVLFQSDYVLDGTWWGFEGWRETEWQAASLRGRLLVAADPQLGLTVTGPAALVAEAQARFQASGH
ncbi:MAG: hypothetical protein ACOY4U_11350 [Pseudomonadota bacterium]